MHIHINEGMQKIQSIWIYSMHNYGQFELLSDKIFNIYQDGSFTTTSGGTVKCQQLYFFYQVLQNKFVHNLRIGDMLKTRTSIQSEKPETFYKHLKIIILNRNSVNQKVLKILPSFRKKCFIFFQFQWRMGSRPKVENCLFLFCFNPSLNQVFLERLTRL